MKRTFLLLSVLFAVFLSQIQAQTKKEVTVEDMWITYTFYPEQADEMISLNNGEEYLMLTSDYSIDKFSYKNSKLIANVINKEMLTPSGANAAVKIQGFELSSDEKKILIKTASEPLYRHSEISDYYVLDLSNKKLMRLSQKGKLRLAELSPDGSKAAYVRDNNMFLFDLATETETAITNDGKLNNIIYGTTDWVYEEEFSFTKAFSWSPDSKKIAYMRFDESNVKEYEMTMWGDLYPETYNYKYPVAGEDNSVVSVWVYDLSKAATTSLSMDIGSDTDIYIPRMYWSKNPDSLAIFRMNRLQNKLEILLAGVNTGKTRTIYTETNKCYIEITDDFHFCEDGKHFILMSEQNGYNHLYLYNLNGSQVNPITTGNWDVIGIKAIDDASKTVYYRSAESGPMNHELYKIQFDGTSKEKLFKKTGSSDGDFSANCAYFTGTYSDGNTPPSIAIYNNKGKEIQTLVNNEKLLELTKEYGFTKKEFFTITTSTDVKLSAYMVKPPDFDASKKYPVLMYVYGGPNSQTVLNEWDIFDMIWAQYLAQKGYIFVAVDGRGTGGKGEEFRKCTYKELGKYETEDQIEAAKYLANQPYVDGKRIGIWGWSYGGFMTLLCMTKGAEYFKAGIAVAPVTSWRNYDNIYTERYMQKPQDNASGYDDNAPVKFAKKLKGKLLIAHGTADDNVHLQNTMEMINALVNTNKQFDMQLYPNKNHGIYGGYTRYHLFKKMSDFILGNL